MYVCVYVYAYIRVCVYLCMYVCIYVCIILNNTLAWKIVKTNSNFFYLYVYMHVCIVRMYVCVYVYMYACVYVSIYVCIEHLRFCSGIRVGGLYVQALRVQRFNHNLSKLLGFVLELRNLYSVTVNVAVLLHNLLTKVAGRWPNGGCTPTQLSWEWLMYMHIYIRSHLLIQVRAIC